MPKPAHAMVTTNSRPVSCPQPMGGSWGTLVIPSDIWLHVCLYLSVEALYMLRATCREMCETIDSHTVWLSVLEDLLEIKPSAYSKQDIREMSAIELRKASLRIVLVDRAYSSPSLPHRAVALFTPEEIKSCVQTLLFPGGKRLLLLHDNGSFRIHNIDERKTVHRVPPPRPNRRESSSTAMLFPESIHTGYIVVRSSYRPDAELANEPDAEREIWVIYRYTADDVKLLFTERTLSPAISLGYTFYHQEGLFQLAQIHLRDAGDYELSLRSFVDGGSDKRDVIKLRTEDEQSDPDALHLPRSWQLISPRYLLTKGLDQVMLFDVSRSVPCDSVSASDTALRPIWRSPVQIRSLFMAAHSVSYHISGQRHFARVTFWAESSTVYFMDIPVMEDLAVDQDIPLSSLKLPVMERTGLMHQIYCGINHGLIRLPLFSGNARKTTDQETLWAYTLIRTTREDSESCENAGCLRLGLVDPSPVRLGRIWQPSNKALKDFRKTSFEICVDDISGRFIQFDYETFVHSSIPLTGQPSHIILYTLDNIA